MPQAHLIISRRRYLFLTPNCRTKMLAAIRFPSKMGITQPPSILTHRFYPLFAINPSL